MKKFIYILFALAISLTSYSQVVMNYATHAPVAGDFSSFSGVNFINPGESGKNVVWDFKNVDLNGKTTFSKQYIPDNDEASLFLFKPNHELEENGNRYFHDLNEKSFSITGFINEDFVIQYQKPLTRMIYPFAYSDFYEGELLATAKNKNNSNIEISGNYSILADAYGEIILPGNIHKKVIRICWKSSSVQVSACYEVNIESTKYGWYSASDRYPIATCVIQEKRFSNGKTEFSQETWINNSVLNLSSPESNENNEMSVLEENIQINTFPNPFREDIQISYLLTHDAEVSMAIFGASGNKIADLQNPSSLKAGIYTQDLNAQKLNLKPGLYFVRLMVDNKVYFEKIMRN